MTLPELFAAHPGPWRASRASNIEDYLYIFDANNRRVPLADICAAVDALPRPEAEEEPATMTTKGPNTTHPEPTMPPKAIEQDGVTYEYVEARIPVAGDYLKTASGRVFEADAGDVNDSGPRSIYRPAPAPAPPAKGGESEKAATATDDALTVDLCRRLGEMTRERDALRSQLADARAKNDRLRPMFDAFEAGEMDAWGRERERERCVRETAARLYCELIAKGCDGAVAIKDALRGASDLASALFPEAQKQERGA